MPRIPTPAWQQPLVAEPDSDVSAAEGEGPSSRTADSEVGPYSGHVETYAGIDCPSHWDQQSRCRACWATLAWLSVQNWRNICHMLLVEVDWTTTPTSHHLYASHLPQVQQLLVRLLPAVLALLRPTLQQSTAGSGDFLSPSGTEPFDVHIPGFCLKLVSAELISSDSAA